MAVQHSIAVRDAKLAAQEAAIGTAPLLRIRTGAQPANCAASRSGTILVSITLPSDWLTAPSSGAAAKAGTWSAASIATGTAAHYEIMDSTGTICHEQGSVSLSGGGGDMIIQNTSIVTPQVVTVTTYNVSQGPA